MAIPSLTGPSIAVTVGVLAVILIPMGIRGGISLIQDGEAARLQAAMSIQAREHDTAMRQNSDTALTQNETDKEEFRTREAELLGIINDQARTIEQRMATDPFAAGNDLHRRFYDVLCKIASGRDNDSRKACGVLASQTFVPGSSPIISVNPETVVGWQQLCEDTKSPDFCNYQIVGFRTGPTYDLLAWLTQLDTTLQTFSLTTGSS